VTRRAWFLFSAVAVLWGVPYLFIKIAVDAGVRPGLIVFARVAVGVFILLPVAATRANWTLLARRWRPLLTVAILDITAPLLLVTFAERSVSSSLAGILVASTPLFLAVLALRFDPSERPSLGQLLGLVIGFVGVAVLLGFTSGSTGGSVTGAIMILTAALGYAIATLIVKHFLSDVPSVGVTTATLGLSSALLVTPAAFATNLEWPPLGALSAMLALGVACTGLAFWAYYALIATAGASRAAVSTYLAPGVAVICGVGLWANSSPRQLRSG
jgi:drug/metabolite transporter (DMT)-like permease